MRVYFILPGGSGGKGNTIAQKILISLENAI